MGSPETSGFGRGIGAMRPLCGNQHGGNRKSQGALALLCEFPGLGQRPNVTPRHPFLLYKYSILFSRLLSSYPTSAAISS